jgi:hypothetical protein
MLLFAGSVSICQQPVGQADVTDGDTPEIDGICMTALVGEPGPTVAIAGTTQYWTSAWLLVPTSFHPLDSLLRSMGELKPNSIPEKAPKPAPSR